MADKRASFFDQIGYLTSADRFLVVQVSNGNTANYTVSLKTLFNEVEANAHFLGEFSIANGALINGGNFTVNCHSILRSVTDVNDLRVGNNHIQLAGTYTPTSNTANGALANSVQIFVDTNYVYVSIDGTIRRTPLGAFDDDTVDTVFATLDNLADLQTEIDDLSASIGSLNSNTINTLQGEINAVSANVTTLASTVSGLSSTVSSLSSNVANIQVDLASLANTVSNMTSGGRTVLTNDLVLHVRTDGSDNNDGSADDSAHAFATLNHAFAIASRNYEQAGYTITIQLADGFYDGLNTTDATTMEPIYHSTGNIIVAGNPSVPYYVTLYAGAHADTSAFSPFNIVGNHDVTLKDISLYCSTFFYPASVGIYASGGAQVTLKGSVAVRGFGAAALMADESGAKISNDTDLLIVRNCHTAPVAFEAFDGGVIVSTPVDLQLYGTWNYSKGFLYAHDNGVIRYRIGGSLSGSSTGRKFVVESNGTITGLNPSLMPGDQDGLVDNSGVYLDYTTNLPVTVLRQLVAQAEPGDPDSGYSITWLSDGNGAGDVGDVMMKINIGGFIKTITLVDYSAA